MKIRQDKLDVIFSKLGRVARRIDRSSQEGCWLWPGKPSSSGYAETKFMGRRYLLHRLIYRLLVGPIPERKWVLHRCDNRTCCNPEHLFVGTPKDNTDDMVAKGRQRWFQRAKLTSTQVREIRDSQLILRELAPKYGVSIAAVSKVRLRQTYRHIQ